MSYYTCKVSLYKSYAYVMMCLLGACGATVSNDIGLPAWPAIGFCQIGRGSTFSLRIDRGTERPGLSQLGVTLA